MGMEKPHFDRLVGIKEEHIKGNLSRGETNSALNSVIIDRNASDLRLAQTLFHVDKNFLDANL